MPGAAMIDTHCHLDFEPLVSDLPGHLAEARQAGVTGFVLPSVHPDGWGGIAAIAGEHAGVCAAFGIHPLHAGLLDHRLAGRLESFARGGVAIGETGLDTTIGVPLELQEQAFREQTRLAVRMGLPLLVHCRKAFARTLAILRQERAETVGGIMHAFSGSCEMAREFARLGFAISLCATVTRPDAARIHRLARELPQELLVLETDSPDLPPFCHRGQPNRPAWLAETLAAVASLRSMPPDELARTCTANTLRVLPLAASLIPAGTP